MLAVHDSPDAPVLAAADVGLVADWRAVIQPLAEALRADRRSS